MRIESYLRHMDKTCRKCNTWFDLKKDYCCAKSREECFADMGLVKKGIQQDRGLRLRLYKKGKMDALGNLTTKKFFRGRFRNECFVFSYRPPGCRSMFCGKWDDYMRDNPSDFVYANLDVVSIRTLKESMMKEFQYGIKLAYPGGFIIFTDDTAGVRKELSALFRGMGLHSFITSAGLMDLDTNEKPGIEIIIDKDGYIGKPRLFGTLINNNMFMLVRMKMNLGSTGFGHANIMVTAMDPEKIAKESPASLKSFHALRAFQV